MSSTITINIMDRAFKIKCPEDKVAELKDAANYLDNKMREVHHGNKLISIDRVAVTAALNISHELMLEKKHPQFDTKGLSKRLFNLKNKLCKPLMNVV